MPIYKVNDKTYNIPDNVASDFEATYPDAVVDIYDTDTGKQYGIPLSKVSQFKEQFPKWAYELSANTGAGELADEQDGGGANAGAMSAIVGGVAGGLAVGAPPTEERKRAMGRELRQIQAQGEAMLAEGRERMANVSEYYSGNPIGFRTVEGKPVFNPESGSMERTYLTPTGDRTTSKTAADMSTYSFRQAMGAADMSVGAQIRRAEAELAELRRQFNTRSNEVLEESQEFDKEKMNGPLGFLLHGEANVRKQSGDKEKSALRVAIRQREEQLKNLYEERDRQAGSDVGFWRGFGRVVGDGRTWDFGTGDLLDAMTMMNADQYSASDATEGEKRAGKDMLKAVYDAQQTEQMFGENASGWYKAGVMGGYMPKFALDFALVGGADAAPTAITKAFTAYLGKKLPAVAANKVGAFSIKVLGCLPEDMARGAAMANSIQLAGTTADAIDRKLGQVELKDGLYTFENPMSWARAIYQAESNTTIENFSEMSGKFIDLPLTKLGKKIFTGRVATQVIAAADKAGLSEIRYGATKMLRHIGINGIPGEIGEEYYGQLWRTIVRNDDRLDAEGNNNFLNWNFHKDIWTGIALTVPLMGALPTSVSAAHYMHYRHKVNKADKAGSSIFQPEEWETIRASIDSATNETMASNIEAILANNSMTIDKKKAVMDYAWATMNMRGYNLADIAANREDNVDPLSQEIDESYIDGYEASSPQEMNDAQNMYEFQRQRLVTELGSLDSEGIDGILSDIDNDPVGVLLRTYEPALREIVLDYANAKILRDGIIQRVNDDIDARIAQSDAMISARVNGASGMILPALMGVDDRQVYVVGGSLAVNEDGSIDRDASDESIVVRDAVTGKLEFTDPKSIVSVGEAINPEMEKAMAAESIRREAAQAAVDAMNGTLAFNPGDVVEINDDGGLIQATIVGPAVDEESGMPVEGQVMVQFANGQQIPFTKEQLQAFADAANLERLNNFEQERAAARAQQQAAEAEAMRPKFALNDEFTILGENGMPIRGSITGERDGDGAVEIYTEEPIINGKKMNLITPAELEVMLDTYKPVNGDWFSMRPVSSVVEGEGSGELAAEQDGEAVALPVPENVENVPNVEENPDFVEQNSENPTETVPKPEEVVEAEPQASALSRVPVDEQGDPVLIHESVDPETAWAGAVEFFGSEEDALAYVNAQIKRSEATIATAEKAVGKIKSDGGMNKYREDLKNARAAVEEAKSAHVRWQDIARVQQLRMEEAKITAPLSTTEKDEFGKPFVKSSDGTTSFGIIDSDSGLASLPIRLSLGENRKDETGGNHGYGWLHIEAGHKAEILNAGFSSIEEFVEVVARSYTDIREGAVIANNQTYLLEVPDKHNNTLFIQLSRDGKYWNVNSAGIFKKKYSRHKPKVYSVPAVGDDTITDIIEVNSDHTKGEAAPAGNSSKTSGGKGSDFALVEQAIGEESFESGPADESAEREQTLGAAVAAAEAVVDTDPTEAQKVAGNYRKGHVQVGTFDVTIEQPVGSVRRGTDADGKAWETIMRNTYGYIRGTQGVDGDHIDVFLATDIDGWNGRRVVIVDQYNPDDSFDEHKVMLGFNDKDEAINAYLANYEDGWENGRRLVFSSATLEDFEKWIESSHRKVKPYHEYKIAEKAEVDESTPENPVYEGAALRVGEKADESSVVYEVAKGMLEAAGIEVTEVSDEEAQEMMRYKNTPVAGQPNRANEKPTSGSVLQRAMGDSSSKAPDSVEADTKIKNNTLSAKNNIRKFKNGDYKGGKLDVSTVDKAISGLGRMLSMRSNGGSRYTVLRTDGGDTVAIRLSDHRANGNNFRRDEADKNLSIVIERKRYDAPESDIEFTEAVIPLSVFEERPAEVIKSIVKGVEDVLADKPFTLDSTIGTVDGTREKSPRFHIRTYHGTGADFDKFDFKHMGSGEGAQAFGWGGYVTEVKSIGKSYASAIGGKGLLPKIEKVQSNINQVEQWLHDHEDYDKYVRRGNKHLKELRREFEAAKKEGNEKDMQFYKELIELQEQSLLPKNHAALIADKHSQIEEYQKELDELMTELAQHRHLYTVRIPDDMGSNYLDWDDKIPDEIKKKVVMETVLEGVSIDFYGDKLTTAEYFARMGEEAAGFQLYRALTQTLGSEQKASELLSRAGITGIKYAANRNNGGRADGKKNFVLFKESDMKISKHIQFLTTSSGEVYGWTINNQVFLNRDAINPETPLHEYTHLWDEMVRKENPELWSRGKELLRETPVWDEVMNDPNYRDIRDDEDAVASEVHSRLTGKEGAGILSDMIDEAKKKGAIETAGAVTLVERLKGWLSDMFESLKATFGKWSRRDLDDLTVEDFKGMTLRDLAEGLAPRQGDMTLERKIKEAGLRIVYYDPNKTGDRRRALLEASDDNNVRFHAAMSSGREDFESLRDRAVAERGIVMPGLNEAQVRVVDVPRHNFTGDKPIAQARKWAKENIVGKHALTDSNGAEVPYTISGRMIDKYLSASAINKSENVGVHLSVLTKLPAVIGESIEAEVHSDYNKDKDGIRSPGNGLSENNLIHRFYGAVDIAGEIYRVKTTIIESNTEDKKKPHSFEVSNVELIEETAGQDGREGSDTHHLRYSETSSEKDTSGNVTTIPVANLLKGVEKSYDSGKKLLEASEKADVSAEEAEVLYRSGETSVEEIVSAKDMAKLGVSDRQAVAEFIRNMPCAKISVIKNTDDVDSESDLSDEAKAELLSTVEAGDTVGAYCHQNKKIYIFANRSQREAVGFTIQSTLVHENAHYLADKMDDIDESYLNRFAEAVDQMPFKFFRNLREKLLSVGYDKDDLPGEIFALTLQWLFQKPKSIDRLKGLLSAADAKIFEKIITEQYGEEGRYKDTVIDGFKHRTDEETNLNGFSRANVEAGPGLGRDRGELGRGERDLSSESGFVDEAIRDNANEYRNIESVRGVLPGRSRGDAASAGIDGGAESTGQNRGDSGADLARKGDGYGAYSDAEVSYMNDPISKVMGKNRFSKKRQAEFAARERQRMGDRIKELAERMHLDNVEILTDTSQLEGKRAKAKGFYNKRTGKITIVIPNNVSTIDAEQTLLHEAVAHYGLRKLFGERFNIFLDNVYQSADESIRHKIEEMADQNGWDFRTATEEYLAGLAEDTNFSEAQSYTGWWSKIKRLFLDMLDKIGFEGFRDKVGVVLTDNELRYILWRSYQNLAEPGRYRSILGEAADVAKQSELKVGNYAEHSIEAEYAAEPIAEINSSYNNQIERWESGEMRPDETVRIGYPMGVMQYFMPNIPILLRQKVLSKSRKKHGLTAAEMKNLPEAIAKPIFVFKSNTETISVLTTLKSENGNNLFVAIELEKDLKLGGHTMIVNDILTIHGREAQNIIEPILHNGTLKYVDKEKGLEWLSSASSSYQQEIAKQGEKSLDRLHSAKSKSQAITNQDLISAAKIVDSFENPTIEGEESLLYRGAEGSARLEYDSRVKTKEVDKKKMKSRSTNRATQLKEAYLDSMQSLRILQEAVSHESEMPIADFENAYVAENQMSSRNKIAEEVYTRDFFEPMCKAVADVCKGKEGEYRKLLDYIIAKHGLERNAYMRAKDVASGRTQNEADATDYAGLTALTEEKDVSAAEAAAAKMVSDYESSHETAELWKLINAATAETLRTRYQGGLISRDTYETIRNQYRNYIPLKGWNETTAADVYEYAAGNYGLSSALIAAHGRSSVADDPLATIMVDAQRTIMEANRNLVKQKFLNLALNHQTNLLSISKQWYVLQIDGTWAPSNPIIPANADADLVDAIVKEHEAEMLSYKKKGKAKTRRSGLKLGIIETNADVTQHVVKVQRNGETFCIYVNGDPRAARAINGMLNPDSGDMSRFAKGAQSVKNFMSKAFTTWNPEFIVGNLSRDVMFAGVAVAVKEDGEYTHSYTKNIWSILTKASLPRLLYKWENGSIDDSNEVERYFREFLMNGGETGFTQLNTVEKAKRDMHRFLREAQGGVSSLPRKAWRGFWNGVEFLNRSAEDTTRFAVYMTSRQQGRSVSRSIHDAKEITVNFNKKGSGAWGARHLNFMYVFFNAAMQAVANAGRLVYRNPGKASKAMCAFMSAGFLMPIISCALAGLGGDGDDDDNYWNLPEWVRRNNLVLYLPFVKKYLTIPIAHELRPFYGMGEIAYSVMCGKETAEDGLWKAVEGFTGILPIDWTGNGGDQIVNFSPTIAQPVAQTYRNVDYFGKPIYKETNWNQEDPEWQKVYKGTNGFLVDLSRMLSEAGSTSDEYGVVNYPKHWYSGDINPAVIEHLLESYTGGLGKTVNGFGKTISMLWNEDARELRNVPVVRKFIQSSDERAEERRFSSDYFKLREEYDESKKYLRKLGNLDDEGAIGVADRVNRWLDTEAGQRYELLDVYFKELNAYKRELDSEESDTIRNLIQHDIDSVRRELVHKVDSINSELMKQE